ncbi:hypothetical protein [Pseudoalteromonas sp. JB197]|uniref:hypothetical protein n=1 Tax=Pseudoalteromonas sp. JB197 TaxID=1434839 RepID=UPI00097F5267|nr:hypothetical protein [Pseudoalteromonas sp. JB197]PCC13108.1 hypothetical protein CIK86_07360 [Pseudoalteromonas sp. JB197]SJN31706.1 hypothetical protein CZ797_06610 [Pseudoalteromonas sp. JB197]
MIKLNCIFIFLLLTTLSFNSFSATNYYKCVTPEGTTFSQFPCDNNATVYKVNTTINQQVGPKVDYTKQLNELERESLLAGLQAELRSNQHKLAILDRKKDQADYKQQQRLNHILAKEDKKRIAADIAKKQKVISKNYKAQINMVKKRINKLQKKIDNYQ